LLAAASARGDLITPKVGSSCRPVDAQQDRGTASKFSGGEMPDKKAPTPRVLTVETRAEAIFEQGSLSISLRILPSNDHQHDLLAALLSDDAEVKIERVSDTKLQIHVDSKDAFARGQRRIENRVRKMQGRPSLEEEEAAIAKADADAAAKRKADDDARKIQALTEGLKRAGKSDKEIAAAVEEFKKGLASPPQK
jgi:hypothetical protein